MTSAEFVAKYKLFKPIAERGARSFLAQEVQGHRAVLVHRLDIAPPDENRRLLGGIEALRPEERGSVIEVADVDGVAIVVTRFTPDFHDLPSWLAQRGQQTAFAAPRPDPSPSPQPSPRGLAGAFSGFGLADAPPPLASNVRTTPIPGRSPSALESAPPAPPPPPPAQAPAAQAGEFTQLFGAPLGGTAAEPARPASPQPAALQDAPPPTAQPSVAPTTPRPGEFTQLFQGVSATSGAPPRVDPDREVADRTPALATPPRADSSWPPAPPIAPPPPPPWGAAAAAQPPIPFAAPAIPQPPTFPHTPPPPATPPPGEFTQLFQGFSNPSVPMPSGPQLPPSPLAATPPGPPGPPVFGDPSQSAIPVPPPFNSPFATPPAPSIPPFGGGPPLPPPFASDAVFAAPPASAPPPPSGYPPSAPPGLSPAGPSAAGPSEFTRMLGAIAPSRAPAVPPPLPIAPPAPASPAAAAQQGGGGSIKAYLPLILGLNVVLIAAATTILYFLLKSG